MTGGPAVAHRWRARGAEGGPTLQPVRVTIFGRGWQGPYLDGSTVQTGRPNQRGCYASPRFAQLGPRRGWPDQRAGPPPRVPGKDPRHPAPPRLPSWRAAGGGPLSMLRAPTARSAFDEAAPRRWRWCCAGSPSTRPAAHACRSVHGRLPQRQPDARSRERAARQSGMGRMANSAGNPIQDRAVLCVKGGRFGAQAPVGGFGDRIQVLDGYAEVRRVAAHGAERWRWWGGVSGTVHWAVICRQQGAGGTWEVPSGWWNDGASAGPAICESETNALPRARGADRARIGGRTRWTRPPAGRTRGVARPPTVEELLAGPTPPGFLTETWYGIRLGSWQRLAGPPVWHGRLATGGGHGGWRGGGTGGLGAGGGHGGELRGLGLDLGCGSRRVAGERVAIARRGAAGRRPAQVGRGTPTGWPRWAAAGTTGTGHRGSGTVGWTTPVGTTSGGRPGDQPSTRLTVAKPAHLAQPARELARPRCAAEPVSRVPRGPRLSVCLRARTRGITAGVWGGLGFLGGGAGGGVGQGGRRTNCKRAGDDVG